MTADEDGVLQPELDEAALLVESEPQLAELGQEPTDASVAIRDGAPVVTPSSTGREADTESYADDVLAAVTQTGDARLVTLPLSRQDECPDCSVSLHVCRMCVYFDVSAVDQCREDDAERVVEKARPNFCDYFKPNPAAFDPTEKSADDAARSMAASSSSNG